MASLRVHPAAVVLLLHVILFATIPVNCNDEEGNLLQGINSFRQSHGKGTLTKHDKADCLADKIADEMEDQPCPRGGSTTTTTGAQPQLANYNDLLDKCDIDINTTRDGVVLPVCVPDRTATLVLTNFTQSLNARYLNDSKYTGIGIGKEDDWTVVVLSTNTPGGSFGSAASLTNMFGLGLYLSCLFSASILFLLN